MGSMSARSHRLHCTGKLGLVPQDLFLFSGSIADNIRFGCPDASDESVIRAAQMANAHDFIMSKPDGYQTRVMEGAANLSIGQRQLFVLRVQY